MLNALIRPCAGEVLIDGQSTKDCTTAQMARRVGYVFQNPDDQIFNSTVYKEIEYGLKKSKLSVEERERWIQDAAELTGIEQYLESNPYDLPLSTRKFVTIASVIASDCDIIVLDEPTAGQDLQGLERLAQLNKVLHSRGKTILTITHDMEFVAAHYERVIVMCDKKILADGKAEEVFFRQDIMGQAMLKQPAIVTIATEIGMPEHTLDVRKVAEYIKAGS